jgi:putative FmdB family regulatory protein
MPIYEYACKNCDHSLDALQKMDDEHLLECPECGKPALRRLISAPRFRLKGAGWYETDFKTDNQRNILKGDSEPAKAAANGESKSAAGDAATSSSDSKSESKSEGKSESKSGSKAENKSESKSESKMQSKTPGKTAGKSGSSSQESS